MENTLVLIKPDGIERKLLGDILSFYENRGLNIVGLKMIKATKEMAREHYKEHEGKEYFNDLINYITEGSICALVLNGENAINITRRINGDKDPLKAELGSIRGTYATEKTRNIVHGSDSLENAKREIEIWFKKEELFCYDFIEETTDLFKTKISNRVEV